LIHVRYYFTANLPFLLSHLEVISSLNLLQNNMRASLTSSSSVRVLRWQWGFRLSWQHPSQIKILGKIIGSAPERGCHSWITQV